MRAFKTVWTYQTKGKNIYKILNIIAFIVCIVWIIYEPSIEAIVVSIATFASFFRDDIHGIIGSNFISLTPKTQLIRNLKTSKYSFITKEYINPAILEELLGWISDIGDQIVSINISESNDSNKFYGNISEKLIENNYPIITFKNNELIYSYQYIGCSFSGVHIIRTWSNEGGTGIFCNIILVTLSTDTIIEIYNHKSIKEERFIIKKVGTIPLGDRYEGNISYKFGFLLIDQCNNIHTTRKKSILLIL